MPTQAPLLTLRRRPALTGPRGIVTLKQRRKADPAPAADAATTQRLQELEAQLAAAQAQLAERAQREERVKAITLRVVDNRAAYAAKTGAGRRPAVTITSRYVDVT